jgi:hypothetical protein
VRTDVEIDVNDNGSGSVTVRIGLDDDAVRRAPDFADSLRTSDLASHGWTVTGPVKDTSGFTMVTASKPFADPDEANAIFKELTSDAGPFTGFTLTRSRSFAHTDFTFTGQVQFGRQGLESFGDSDLASQLDGEPLGQDITAIEKQIDEIQDNAFPITLTVRLPGSVDSNAPGQFANGARWQLKLSEPNPVTLDAKSRSTRWLSIVGAGVAVVAAVLLLIVLVLTAVRRRRGGVAGSHGGAAGT